MVNRIYGYDTRYNNGFWTWTYGWVSGWNPIVKFNEYEFIVLTDYFELAQSLFFTMRNQKCTHYIENITFPCYVIYDHKTDFLNIRWYKEEKPKDFVILQDAIKKVKELEFYE